MRGLAACAGDAALRIGVLAILMASGCASEPIDQYVTALDPVLREYLVAGDAEATTDWVRREGAVAARLQMAEIIAALREKAPEEFEARREALLPAYTTLCNAVAEAFDLPIARGEPEAYRHMRPEDLDDPAFRERGWELAVMHDPEVPEDRRLELLREHATRCREVGLHWRALFVDFYVAQLVSYLGRPDEARAIHERAAEEAIRLGAYDMASQHLGSLSVHAQRDPDGSIETVEELRRRALEFAHRSRQPGLAARMHAFAASDHFARGEITLAHARYQEAIDWCETYLGRHHVVRYLTEAARFNARLGAWDTVRSLVDRIDARLRLYPLPNRHHHARWATRARMLRAQVLLANGRTDEAIAIWEDARATLHDARQVEPEVPATVTWAQALLDHDRPSNALEVIERGLVVVEANNLHHQAYEFAVLGATAASQAGDREATAHFLERLDREGPPSSALNRVLECAARCAIDDSPTALDRAIDALGDLLGEIAAGPHGYLRLESAAPLRRHLASVLASDPARLYEFEMAWRGLTRGLAGPADEADRIVDELRQVVTGSDPFVATTHGSLPPDGVHLVYRVESDHVVRLRATRHSVDRAVLDVDPLVLRTRIEAVLAEMSEDPGDPGALFPASLRDALVRLGRLLLPADVTAGDGPLLVSLDGAIDVLPFGLLGTSDVDDYHPLIASKPPLLVRHTRPSIDEPDDSGRALVVADPVPAPWLQRLYPSLRVPLESSTELDALRATWKDAEELIGEHATESAILARWESIDRLYLISHVGHLQTARHCAFVPTSVTSPHDRSGAVHLDVGDVLDADLRTCRLVVLSGCGSGAPRLEGRRAAPSLADAFLDAGAAATLSTLWSVRDDQASHFLAEVVRTAGASDPDLDALTAVQLAWARDGEAWTHPYAWGGYAMEVSWETGPAPTNGLARRE